MSYKDRLRAMEYTSPSGATFTLRYTEVSREVGKKAPVSELPLQDQGAVQDLGQTTPRFPVTCWVDGENYDQVADRLWQALNESGSGRLDHPRYGTIAVLPVSVTSAESFIDGAGRATFEIDFVKTSDESFEYPRSSRLAKEQVRFDTESAAAAVIAPLEGVEVEGPGRLAALKDQALAGVDAVTDAFDSVREISDDVRTQINSQVREITDTIDDLVEAPEKLAASFLSLYRLPADVIADVGAKIDGYAAMFTTIADAAVDTTERYGEIFGLTGSAQAQGVAIAAAESTADGTAETREDAAAAVEALRGLADSTFDTVEALGVEDYESVAATRKAVTTALNALIESSLDLPMVRVRKLDQDITPIELAYELYGVDADLEMMLDRIIGYNSLTGSEIIMIPAGKEVRWYE